MNIVIFYEDTKFSQLLENFVKDLGYDVVINTNELAIIKERISETPEIYILECNAKGLQIFDFIDKDKKLVIFITESHSFLSKNLKYKICSFNYIHKSLLSYELKATLDYAKQKLLENNLFIYRSKYKKVSIPKNNIYMIEAVSGKDRGLSSIYHENGNYKIRVPLKKLEKSLGANFKRCHRKYIVNIENVISFETINGKKILHLADHSGLSCPTTLTVKEVKEWLC